MKSKTTPTSKNTSDPNSDPNSDIEQIKVDLLSLVSHELKTPLTSVLNSLRVLRDEDLSVAERASFLEMALRNAEKLNVTLSQLLDLSKLVSGRLVCRFHELSLRTLIAAQVERFEADAAKTGHKFSKNTAMSALANLPVILGDGPRLEKVVASVFENALRFSPPGSALELKIQAGLKRSGLPEALATRVKAQDVTSEFVTLELTNAVEKGTISADDDVFRIFSQSEDILNRTREGVGGSLALGAEVLRQHGGAMHAEVNADVHAGVLADEQSDKFTVWIVVPVLEGESALLKVLESRMYAYKTELGALSLMLLEVPGERPLKQVHQALKSALFRASDTVYGMGDSHQIAVLMDDCKKDDATKIVGRLLTEVGAESAKFLSKFLEGARVGIASFPDDGTDPRRLLEYARSHLTPVTEVLELG